jgi:hypothetical protein
VDGFLREGEILESGVGEEEGFDGEGERELEIE